MFYICNLIIFLTHSLLLHKYLHVYQLKSYNTVRYLRYFKNKKSCFLVFCLVFYFIVILINSAWLKLIIYTIFYILNLIFVKNFIKSEKTPLKFTKKLIRINILSILILSIMCLYKYAFLIIIILTPLVPILANTINIYDKLKAKIFISSARKKIKNSYVKIIAITGSNGKTSVKNILDKMLSKNYIVQATPASYNTPLGIAKFINEELKFSTEYLILEYGARRKGDIKKLCKLYGADYGIITTIAPQHLETFKSIENIFLEKNYLAKFLKNKPCIFNVDNLYCLRGFSNKTGNKTSCSIFSSANVCATDFMFKNFKMEFNLNINSLSKNVSTNLLGEHNVSNICLAAALANNLYISQDDIISTISNLTPTPHRLNLIKSHINILDDSFNCSPASAKQALNILKEMPNKKMVVTPGIIEGGKSQYSINFNLGKNLAEFDYCIIVGETNKKALTEGIKNAGLSNTCIVKHAQSLEHAKQYFALLKNSDSLLLLNDLPDDYN